jgi:heterodisulfide reductase subunit B
MDKNPDLRKQMNEKLALEDLVYNGTVKIWHTLEVLHAKLDVIGEKVTRPVGKLVATHYGCHTIRYSDANRADHAESPHKIEDILEAIGAETKEYPERLNCCGGPWLANEVASGLTKSGQKLKAVFDHGFDGLCHVCPWGHRMMDVRQQEAATTVAASFSIPVFYLTQLVGLAFGIDEKELGLHLNQSCTEDFLGGGE